MLIAKLPRYIEDADLMLRPLRIWDGPFLARMLARKDILWSCGLDSPSGAHWLTLYRRLRSIFFLCYRIDYASERVGLAGLYDLRADKSAAVSLMIFRDCCRRSGLGTKCFHMLSASLGNLPFIEKIRVSVVVENKAAQAFWTKLGFKETGRTEQAMELSLSLIKSLRTAIPRFEDERTTAGDYSCQSDT